MASKGPKTYASGISIALSLLSTTGILKPTRDKVKADSTCLLCPDCETPTKVSQQYMDVDGVHGPFTVGELARGKVVGDEVMFVTADEITTVRQGEEADDSKTLQLLITSAGELLSGTEPTGISYAFLPDKSEDPVLGVLCDLIVDNPELAYHGFLTLRGSEKLFLVQRRDYGLILIELCRPEDVHSYPSFTPTYNPKHLAMASQLVEAERHEYDPESYRSAVRERMTALVATKTGSEVPVGKVSKPVVKVDSLEAMLAASLAKAKK